MRAPRQTWLAAACLLVGAFAGCDEPPPPRPIVEAPSPAPPEPAPPAAPSDPPPVPPAPPLSLPAIQRRLDPALRAAANAAPGIRSEPGAGNTGRTYEALARPATAAPPIDMVHAAIASVLVPDPEPFQTGYYREVEPIEVGSVDAIVAALRFEEPAFPETPDEPAARAALASALAREVAAPASRGRAFFARAGWADAEGQSRHGLAFVDPQTGQVLWIYVFELWRP